MNPATSIVQQTGSNSQIKPQKTDQYKQQIGGAYLSRSLVGGSRPGRPQASTEHVEVTAESHIHTSPDQGRTTLHRTALGRIKNRKKII
jgi:hypothetical protein